MSPEHDVHQDHNHEHLSAVQFEQLPEELHVYHQWVCWRYVERKGKKPDKQPVNPYNLHNAGVHWANTWSTGDRAYQTYLKYAGHGIDGIGFVLTRADPFVGVDLDNCVGEDGFTPYAEGIMQQLQSYTEYSPSGRGLHVLINASGYNMNRRTPALEIYAHSRFLTLTGRRIEGTPQAIKAIREEQITTLMPDGVHAPQPPTASSHERSPEALSDMQLWEWIFEHDKYGTHHLQRFQGDLSLDNGDHSLGVVRLLNTLARWTGGDPVKMRSMMLRSGLANAKWFSKRGKLDWLDYQITNAIKYVQGRR